jgi:hypothetical protein
MYQASGSPSASGSPGSSPGSNALKLGRPVGSGAQGYGGQRYQHQQQEIAGFGAAGAAMEADQNHFYAGQGHEQWQTTVQGQGSQQAKGSQRLVSSMGEQGAQRPGMYCICLDLEWEG